MLFSWGVTSSFFPVVLNIAPNTQLLTHTNLYNLIKIFKKYIHGIISLNLYKLFLCSFRYLFTLRGHSNHNLGATYSIFLFPSRYGIYFNMKHLKLSKASCLDFKLPKPIIGGGRGWGGGL